MRTVRFRASLKPRPVSTVPSVGLTLVLLALILATALAGVWGCGTGAPASAAATGSTLTTSATTAGSSEPAVGLCVTGPSGTKSFTVADLQAMKVVTGYGGYTCPPTPGVTGPDQYTGVDLSTLLATVGGLTDKSVVSVAASDDYVMTYTADQIQNGSYATYDPASGKETKVEELPQTIVAYTRDGSPVGKDEGPVRLAFLTSQPNQVVEGFLWVKWVTRIQVRDADEDWTLKIDGAKAVSLDRAAFADLVAVPGNKASWEDIQGRWWTGVPIGAVIRLVAGADPNVAYAVELIGGDGATLTLDSTKITADDDYIVASEMEGNPLGDMQFPVSLVGRQVADGKYISDAEEFIKGITEIRVTKR
jgi:DMSO/TMAO reductase YedYZ molybdopterin-dependent catalytic subunit